jgi:hypothetical protein
MRWQGMLHTHERDDKCVQNFSRRSRHRWEDNIKLNIKIMYENVNWMHLTQNRRQLRALVNVIMNLRVPLKARNFSANCPTLPHGVTRFPSIVKCYWRVYVFPRVSFDTRP